MTEPSLPPWDGYDPDPPSAFALKARIQPSEKAMTERIAGQLRDIFDLARQVCASESDWGLYKIASHLMRSSGEIAEAYQVLSCIAAVVRHIAARCGDAPGLESPTPKLAEQVINDAVRGVNDSLMRRVIGHRTAALQKQVCMLADPRIPVALIPKLAEQFAENAAGGQIDRLEAVESGIHLIAWLASMSGDALAALNAAERELLAPIEAELRRLESEQPQEIE
jgi:hypothetical protein